MIYGPLQNAGVFLIKTIFNLYISLILVRCILQAVRADFYHPISQAIIKITNPLIIPLRKIIPSFRSLDLATLFLAIILQFTEIFLLTLLGGSILKLIGLNQVLGILILVAGALLAKTIQLYTFFIFLAVILSWIEQNTYNPIMALIGPITEPLMRRARKILPTFGGLDFSAIIVLIGLQLASYLISDPMLMLGNNLYAR